MAKDIGLIIRELRGDMSLREFAKKCDVSHTTIDNLEKGVDFRTGKPTQVKNITLQKIAVACDVSLAYLLGETDSKTPIWVTESYDEEDPSELELLEYYQTIPIELRSQTVKNFKAMPITSTSASHLLTPQTEKEQKILFAYRTHPEMQPAVDRLLGIEKDDKIVLYQAAHSDNNAKDGYIKKDKTQWNKIEKASETEDDLL